MVLNKQRLSGLKNKPGLFPLVGWRVGHDFTRSARTEQHDVAALLRRAVELRARQLRFGAKLKTRLLVGPMQLVQNLFRGHQSRALFTGAVVQRTPNAP